jgi:two-component system, chemotaxis family, sensor kinase CheA
LLKSIFRTIHTIKGTCGFLGFTKLKSLAHAGETLLSVLRDGQLRLNTEITTALLAMVDAVGATLTSIDSRGNKGERNDNELIATPTRVVKPQTAAKIDRLFRRHRNSPRSSLRFLPRQTSEKS